MTKKEIARNLAMRLMDLASELIHEDDPDVIIDAIVGVAGEIVRDALEEQEKP